MKTGPIDWNGVKSRLAKAEQALAAALVFDEKRKDELLRRRADTLAARKSILPREKETQSVMIFLLGQERYGVDLASLRQVVPLDGLAPVPGTPDKILGVMNLRGEVGSIWDLARLMDISKGEAAMGGHVLVLKAEFDVGFLVGYVEGRQEIDTGAMIMPGAGESALPMRFLRGLTPERIHVLNAEALLESVLSETDRLDASDDNDR